MKLQRYMVTRIYINSLNKDIKCPITNQVLPFVDFRQIEFNGKTKK